MTDKRDFKGALAALGNESHDTENIDGYVSIYIEDVVSEKTLDAIEFALKLAERMQSGEVSEGYALHKCYNCGARDNNHHKRAFKAMTTQMIKDIEDD